MEAHNVKQGTDEWFDLRYGLPTASEFKKVLTATGKPSTQKSDYAALLAAEMYAGRNLERWEGNQWTERGNELEPEARAMYELTAGVDVVETGFIKAFGVGCSPDGLVGDDGLVEIKCLSPQKHVLALAYVQKHAKPPSDYVAQIQGQMYVTGRQWCDLYFYHPALPPTWIRAYRDDKWIDTLQLELQTLIAERDRLHTLLKGSAK